MLGVACSVCVRCVCTLCVLLGGRGCVIVTLTAPVEKTSAEPAETVACPTDETNSEAKMFKLDDSPDLHTVGHRNARGEPVGAEHRAGSRADGHASCSRASCSRASCSRASCSRASCSPAPPGHQEDQEDQEQDQEDDLADSARGQGESVCLTTRRASSER